MKPPSPEECLKVEKPKVVDRLTETIASMTPKQQAYALERIANPDLSIIEAAKKAGYSLTAKAKPSKVTAINEAEVRKLLGRSGLSLRKILKSLKEEANATMTITSKVKMRDENGKPYDKVISREIPLHAVRLKAIDIALRLHGAYAATKFKVSAQTDHNFNLNALGYEELKRLKAERDSKKEIPATFTEVPDVA